MGEGEGETKGLGEEEGRRVNGLWVELDLGETKGLNGDTVETRGLSEDDVRVEGTGEVDGDVKGLRDVEREKTDLGEEETGAAEVTGVGGETGFRNGDEGLLRGKTVGLTRGGGGGGCKVNRLDEDFKTEGWRREVFGGDGDNSGGGEGEEGERGGLKMGVEGEMEGLREMMDGGKVGLIERIDGEKGDLNGEVKVENGDLREGVEEEKGGLTDGVVGEMGDLREGVGGRDGLRGTREDTRPLLILFPFASTCLLVSLPPLSSSSSSTANKY